MRHRGKNVSQERLDFLKKILAYNGFTVIAVPTPAPKAALAPQTRRRRRSDGSPPVPEVPNTFTVGVTDYTFNPINAIFGRLRNP